MKIYKPNKKIIRLILFTLVLLISAGGFYFLFLREESENIWYSESWTFRKSIFLDPPEEVSKAQQEILIELDTAVLISEGKLQSNCEDIRFIDQESNATLKYWIEGGCNSTETQIWVRLLNGNSQTEVIYLYYGNEKAPDGQEEWGGEFISMSESACEENWALKSDLQGRFPLGSETYGKTGGDEDHIHKIFNTQSCDDKVIVANTQSNEQCNTTSDNIFNNNTSSFSNIPEHRNINFCSSENGFLIETSIIISDKKTEEGWEHISILDEKYPRGNDGESLELSNSHKHSSSCINSELSLEEGNIKYLSLNSSTDTKTTEREVPHYNVNFVSKNSRGAIPTESIMMVTSIPPLGWELYSDMNDKFPRGTERDFKETGGSSSHFHMIKPDFSIKNTTSSKLSNIENIEVCLNGSSLDELETSQSGNLPPYITVIFAKKRSSYTYRIGEEEGKNVIAKESSEITSALVDETVQKDIQKDNGNVLGATAPNAPSDLLTDGQTNPTGLSNPTPLFSAVYNDPDIDDTSSFYEIEVNTASDFSGTFLWNSGKTTMPVTIQGTRSSDILYRGNILGENITYYWRIKFWDSDNNESSWSTTATFSLSANPTTTSLLTCGFSNPTFITPNLTFSAIYTDPGSTDATNYEIEINTNSEFTGTVIWDSGKTTTSIISGQRSQDYAYAGPALAHDGTTYHIRMRFWDSNDVVSEWAVGQFNDTLKGFRLDGLDMDGIKLD